MPSLSATFSVEGSTAVQRHSVAYGQTIDFAIQSLTGIETIEWSIVGTSKSTQAALTITPAGSPSGATASCVMPSDPGDGLGRAFAVKLRVANQQESAVAYRIFGKANSAGIVPLVVGEELWGNATHGYTDIFNQALNAIGGAAGGTTQLLYNNAGAIDGASGITVVGSETGLSLSYVEAGSGTKATAGEMRWPATAGIYFRNTGAANVGVVRVGNTTDDLWIGDTTAGSDTTIFAATTVTIGPGGAAEYTFTSSALDMNGNNLSEVGALDHDGSTLGFYGTAPTTKQAPTGSRGGNAALASLLTALATIGLITDSTSA